MNECASLDFSGIQQLFSAHFFANLGPRAGCESERMGRGKRRGFEREWKGRSGWRANRAYQMNLPNKWACSRAANAERHISRTTRCCKLRMHHVCDDEHLIASPDRITGHKTNYYSIKDCLTWLNSDYLHLDWASKNIHIPYSITLFPFSRSFFILFNSFPPFPISPYFPSYCVQSWHHFSFPYTFYVWELCVAARHSVARKAGNCWDAVRKETERGTEIRRKNEVVVETAIYRG